jgi:D-alanyl-D-alanine carboxypeptidase
MRTAPPRRPASRTRRALGGGVAGGAAVLALARPAGAASLGGGGGLAAATVQRLDAALRAALATIDASGVVAGIVTPQGRWTAAAGVADPHGGAPMLPGVYQRVGSVTKTFTVTLVLQLMEQGRLSLDDPVARYLDGVPNGGLITLRHLADMSSGLFSYTFDDEFVARLFANPSAVWTPNQLLAVAFAHPVNFQPGAGWEYSNTNTIVLGRVIEQVTGAPLGEAYRRGVFERLGLRQTSFPDGTPAYPAPHARGYTEQGVAAGAPAQDATDWNPSWAWSAGAIVSTLDDLLRYTHALGTGVGLLEPATQRLRLASFLVGLPPNTPQKAYGLGIGLGSGWVGHTGELPGYNTTSYYHPGLGASVVVMANSDISATSEGPASTVFGQLAAVLGAPIG